MIVEIIIIYLLIYIYIFLHELAHLISGFIICGNKSIKKIKIGTNIFSMKFKKIQISPFISESYVEIIKDDLLKKGKIKSVVYFISGIIINLIIGSVLIFSYKKSIKIVGIINYIYAIVNLLPMYNFDGHMILKIIRNKCSIK